MLTASEALFVLVFVAIATPILHRLLTRKGGQ